MGENRRKWRPGPAATALVEVRGVQGMHSTEPCKHLGAQDPLVAGCESGEAGALDITKWENAPHGRKVPVGPSCCSSYLPILLQSLLPRPNPRARAAGRIVFWQCLSFSSQVYTFMLSQSLSKDLSLMILSRLLSRLGQLGSLVCGTDGIELYTRKGWNPHKRGSTGDQHPTWLALHVGAMYGYRSEIIDHDAVHTV